jgi:hypothetical protein
MASSPKEESPTLRDRSVPLLRSAAAKQWASFTERGWWQAVSSCKVLLPASAAVKLSTSCVRKDIIVASESHLIEVDG